MERGSPNGVASMAGFWRRLGAFCVDGLVLGLVGWGLGLILGDLLSGLGSWGRLVGLGVAWPYFAVQNSRVGGGQTLGKRLLGIEVVSQDGGHLSLPRAFARFVPLGAAWFLNGVLWPGAFLQSWFAAVVSFAVMGVGLCVLYLFAFNRATRQSLHDLMVGSFVVRREGVRPQVAAQPLWWGHRAVCAVLLVASAALPTLGQQAASGAVFGPMLAVSESVGTLSWVRHVQVSKGQSVTRNADQGDSQTRYLRVSVHCVDADIDSVQRAKQAAVLALAADASARDLDVVQVDLIRGHDIGIYSSWRTRHHVRSPAAWLAP